MRLSIDTSGVDCPAGLPVSLFDVDSGEVLARYSSVADAAQHRRLLETDFRSGDQEVDGGVVDEVDPEFRRGFAAGCAYGYRQAVSAVFDIIAQVQAAVDGPDDDTEPDWVVEHG